MVTRSMDPRTTPLSLSLHSVLYSLYQSSDPPVSGVRTVAHMRTTGERHQFRITVTKADIFLIMGGSAQSALYGSDFWYEATNVIKK